MWNDRIRNTALTTQASQWFFLTEHPTNIEISDDRSTSDSSLLSTLRFLLYNKLGTDGKLKVLGMQTNASVDGSSIPYRMRRSYARCNNHNIDSLLVFVETNESPENMKYSLETTTGIERTADALLPAGTIFDCGTVTSNSTGEEIPLKLTYQQSITYFFGNKFGVYVFTDPEKRVSLVITSRLNNQKYHWLQAVIPMLLPWYFASEDGSINLDPKALSLLEKLNSTDKNGYLSVLKEFADSLGYEDTYVDAQLKEFLISAQRNLIDNANNEVEDMRRRVQEYMSMIGQYTRNIQTKLAYITGLELSVENTQNTEFAEYIKNNNAVTVSGFGAGTMQVLCHGVFEYFNTDALQALLDDTRSYIYTASNGTKLGDGKIIKLLTAIFIDEKFKLKVCAPYQINIRENMVDGLSGDSISAGFEDYLPNPHIYHHGCIGDYRAVMAQYVTDGNWIGVVDQCVTSNATMNFYDSTVTRELVSDLISNYDTRKCIVLPDGSDVTIKEAVEYLEAEE